MGPAEVKIEPKESQSMGRAFPRDQGGKADDSGDDTPESQQAKDEEILLQ